VRFADSPAELDDADLLIIPGTKSTIADLAWLRDRGLADAIARRRAAGTPIFGICGGFQMLGTSIVDEDGVEAKGSVDGLGLLPISTTFSAEKVTHRVVARTAAETALWGVSDVPLEAYEIHMGRTVANEGAVLGAAPCAAMHAGVESPDGAASRDGLVVGTYMHGLFENDALRRGLLARLAARKGVALPDTAPLATIDQTIDALADSVAAHLDLEAIGDMVGLRLLSPA
jgi:adenosylcobyric acid synthase